LSMLSSRERLLALVEVTVFETCLFISAWLLQTTDPEGYGWYSKIFMIVLGLLAIFIHGRPQEYGLRPKNLGFSLRWSVYIALLFATIFIATLSLALLAGSPLPEPIELVKDLV